MVVTPFLLGGVRFIVAGSLMYAFLRWRGVPAPSRVQWRNLAMMGVLLLLMGNGLVNVGEQNRVIGDDGGDRVVVSIVDGGVCRAARASAQRLEMAGLVSDFWACFGSAPVAVPGHPVEIHQVPAGADRPSCSPGSAPGGSPGCRCGGGAWGKS